MNSLFHTLKNASSFGLGTYLLLVANSGYSAALDLSEVPLFLGESVDPNLLLIIDDSGSMDWVQTMSTAAKREHPELVNNEIVDVHTNRNRNQINISYRPEGEDESRRLCAAFNVLAYDPDINYTPWAGVDEDGQAYPDMTYTGGDSFNVRIDPYLGGDNGNLTDIYDHAFITWNDANGNKEYDNGECPEVILTGTGRDRNFTNAACEANSNCFLVEDLSNDVPVSINPNDEPQHSEITNYGNWYTYYRKREFIAKKATLGVIDAIDARVGIATLHDNNNVSTPIDDLNDNNDATNDDAIHKLNLMGKVAQINSSGGTPLRVTLEDAGEYFLNGDRSLFSERVTSPILSAGEGGACQKNASILMSDGFANSSNNPSVGNLDGDNLFNTLGDVAQKYFDIDFKIGDDYEGQQNMTTHTIAFGVEGNLTCNPGEDGCAEDWPTGINYDGSDPRSIDDMRHAAYNSKGLFSTAQTPEALIATLEKASTISTGGSGFTSVATNSSSISSDTVTYQGSFNPDTWSGDLSAIPISIGDDDPRTECNGVEVLEFCDPIWSAAELLDSTAQTSRVIITSKTVTTATGTSTTGIPFAWPSNYTALADNDFSEAQVEFLVSDVADAQKQSEGQKLVDYLRGDRSYESASDLRIREHVLGDIVNSAPRFVGTPSSNHPDTIETDPYSTYRADNEDRDPMLYVGSNDGMLHGFDFETGEERLAYVPEAIFGRLKDLTQPLYDHQYTVDGTPTTGDAYLNNNWTTVLLGGLNAGGQSIYALDISDPDDFSQNNADNIVLWEYTDADLGYTFGQPDIVRLNDGSWAALFGNGYNNTEADGLASTTGKGYLYLVDLEDGELIEKIEVDSGSLETPNGLSTATPVDINGDSITDYVYAGDLNGNLWRFNLTSNSSNNWDVELIFTAVAPEAGNPTQPITSRPSVSFHPENDRDGFLIFFGTGRYIDVSDNDIENQTTQSFYAVWDDLDDSLINTIPAEFNRSNSDYVEQSIIDQSAVDTDDGIAISRTTSSNTIDWNVHSGWYIDLTYDPAGSNLGERQISSSLLDGDSVIFISTQPRTPDEPDEESAPSCDTLGISYLMVLDYSSGAAQLDTLDIDGDGNINADDIGNAVQINGIVGTPTIVDIPDGITTEGTTPDPDPTPEPEPTPTPDCQKAALTGVDPILLNGECPAGTDRQSWNEILRD